MNVRSTVFATNDNSSIHGDERGNNGESFIAFFELSVPPVSHLVFDEDKNEPT